MTPVKSNRDRSRRVPPAGPTPWRGQMPALALAGSSRFSRLLARALVVMFGLVLVGVTVLPWQQSVRGTGRVIAFDPLDRRINVEAPVSGRLKHLHVTEGQRIRKGDLLVEIQDNDPDLVAKLGDQREAVTERRAAATQRVLDLANQIDQQERAKSQAILAARQRIAGQKVVAETARINFDRTEALATGGLVSQRDLELAIQARDSAVANLAAEVATLARTEREFDAAIARIRADKTAALGDLAATARDLSSAEIAVNQARQQTVHAPRDGIVLKVAATEGTFLRPGSLIAILIPETEGRFAEILLQGNDVPLVTARHTARDGRIVPGSPVRLRFEGWPAIQFVGWPSVAVGTFGGEVVFVDATDDGSGKFRIVVAPKADQFGRADGMTESRAWPANQWLRQGVRADGWVLLQQVPLWKEIWRQLNAFPPVVAPTEPEPVS